MQWVYAIPVWLASLIIIGACCAISAAGLYLIRGYDPKYASITHNDVAGPVMATIGTVMAVMLSFMVVTVWQQYDQSAATVDKEASAIADLYHAVGALPASVRLPVRAGLERYVDLVISNDWPAMRYGGNDPRVRATALDIVRDIQTYEPATYGQQNVAADAIEHAHEMLDARRDRLFQNQEAVPSLVWVMMIFVAAVTVASTYLFRVDDARAHYLMSMALAAVIGATFVMLAEFDLPFRGEMQIDPRAFAADYAVFSVEPNR